MTDSSLDWPAVVSAWSEYARTSLGKDAIGNAHPLPDVPSIERAFDAVSEMLALEDQGVDAGAGGVADIRRDTDRGSRGEVLADDELQRASATLVALVRVARNLEAVADQAPTLAKMASMIHVDPFVVDQLRNAWDNTGKLSASAFPQLKPLRQRIGELHDALRSTLDRLAKGDEWADALQDRFWTQRDNRYVLPVKPFAKGLNLGIVHGTSRTAQTVFIEPHQVVSLNNQLRLAEGDLAAEEHRIRAALSAALGSQIGPVTDAMDAATQIDIATARAGLARRLQACRPTVGAAGQVLLKAARHPVLSLRGIEVVPNDLELSSQHPCLVISGPNAGGKTVALKTIGLMALLVQHGCFIPAAEGSRIDRFDPIIAVIGDQQTVEGDLSSFSAHIVALKALLESARPGTLALLDELASGTDPAQGAALAQSVLETLLDQDARLVVTTHYARLKGMAAADPRFAVAATQYREGLPTYRLVPGATGESRAFELASRMGLDSSLLERAQQLMSDGEVQLSRALTALERERERALVESEEMTTQHTALAKQRKELERREAHISKRAKALEEEGARHFLKRLKTAEAAIGQVVAELQAGPSHKGVKAARAAVAGLRGLVAEEPAPAAVAKAPSSPLAPGDRVRLVRLHKTGEVLAIKPNGVRVRTGALTLTVQASELQRLSPDEAPAPPKRPPAAGQPTSGTTVRIASNTLDLRGQRVDEALAEADRFFDRAVLQGHDVVYLLHGHGTGALKNQIRKWLRTNAYVERYAPANAEQGGDAYTLVVLK